MSHSTLFGLCELPFIPMRKEAAHRSEMVSQLLFGETFEILETAADSWYFIRCHTDQYTGWITHKNLHTFHEDVFGLYNQQDFCFTTGLMTPLEFNSKRFHIGFGSKLLKNPPAELTCYHCKPLQVAEMVSPEISTDKAIAIALRLLNTSYLWGGRSSFGFDCSGFVQSVYKLTGLNLPRDASEQSKVLKPVDYTRAKAGDIAFFKNDEGKIIHTGILMSPDRILHCSDCVRIDHLDEQGIINEESGKYTHFSDHIAKACLL